MVAVESKPRVVRRTVDQEIRRLETYIRRMESHFGRELVEVADAVASGSLRETAELARWITNYNVLMSLREAPAVGNETGLPTSSTRSFTKAAWNRSKLKA